MRTAPALLATALASAALLVGGPGTATAAPAAVIEVTTAKELKAALTAVRPGDTIRLADGTYTGNFKATVPATAGARITLTGSPRAVLTASGGYGLHLNGAAHWTVENLTVTGGQ
ncbi:sheath polysaccharide-degrading enzyme, partial [Streptomyces albidoflavus]